MKILPFTNNINTIITELLLISLLIFVTKKLNLIYIFKFTFSSFINGLIKGWYVILLALFLLILGSDSFISNNFSFKTLLLIIISNLIVGIFEELLCRGILFNKFLKFYTPFKAAIFSSLIFAFAHFINYFDSTSIIEVTSQIIYAFFLGVFFAAIYYFTQNIWSVMLLHALIDIVYGLTESNNLNMDLASSIVSSFIAIIIVSPAFFIGKRMFRINNKTTKSTK